MNLLLIIQSPGWALFYVVIYLLIAKILQELAVLGEAGVQV